MELRRVVIVGVVIVVLTAAGITFWQLSPQVESFSPADGTRDVRPTSQVKLTFSLAMQPETVEARLTFQPSREGEYSWEGNTLTFTPLQPWSAGEQVTVSLARGARSTLGLAVPRALAWSFTIAQVRLAYLWPADGSAEIYALDLLTHESEQLTNTAGVVDFSVAPDSTTLFYSAANDLGGSELWSLDYASGEGALVLDCGRDLCSSPQLSPDGGQLAYERTPTASGGQATHMQVWLLQLERGETMLVGQPDHQTRAPAWSPTGWLAVYDMDAQAFLLVDPATDETIEAPNQAGEAGNWSSDGRLFVFPELYAVDALTSAGVLGGSGQAVLSSHLLAYNLLSGQVEDLTFFDYLEDTSPTFSPDGELLAFARKYLDEQRWTLGRQLWLMSALGTDLRMLTDSPDYEHTAFAWHPDGGRIAYVRFNEAAIIDPPELWVINADGSGALRMMIGAYSPQWLP